MYIGKHSDLHMQKIIFMVQGALQSIELQSSSAREIALVALSELTDNHSLVDYKCGTLRMVTLKRYIHMPGNYS